MVRKSIDIQWVKSIAVILLACFYIPVFSQTDTIQAQQDTVAAVVATVPVPAPQPVDFRVPDKSKIEEFQKDSRFDYKRNVERKASWWDQLKYKIFKWLGKSFGSVFDSGVVGYFVVIIIIILLCLLILKFLGIDYRSILGKKKLDTPEIDIYTENVHEMDFNSLIANAMKNRDYRLATRFLYLKNLKLLSDKEYINWQINKTNYSYQHEISNQALRSKFLENTLIFDYVWYGEFSVDETQFSEIYNKMDNFSKMITNG
ncbi:MAG: hypothetical protein E6767_02230 [Dysgonomonas sp.]|nr:hypothetical protein [Dysgonomonas sp.]